MSDSENLSPNDSVESSEPAENMPEPVTSTGISSIQGFGASPNTSSDTSSDKSADTPIDATTLPDGPAAESSQPAESGPEPVTLTGISSMQGITSGEEIAATSSDAVTQNNAPISENVNDVQEVDPPVVTLPDGTRAVVSGSPEEFKELNHKQGDNEKGFEGTCGLVSVEEVANQFGKDVSEDDVVSYAIDNNLTVTDSNDNSMNGGTTPEQQAAILNGYGIPSQVLQLNSMDDLSTYIEQGHGVILETNAGVLWNDANYLQGGQINHAVVATGVAHDELSGSLLGFFINDSGTNESGQFIPVNTMNQAWLQTGGYAVITNQSSSEEE